MEKNRKSLDDDKVIDRIFAGQSCLAIPPFVLTLAHACSHPCLRLLALACPCPCLCSPLLFLALTIALPCLPCPHAACSACPYLAYPSPTGSHPTDTRPAGPPLACPHPLKIAKISETGKIVKNWFTLLICQDGYY